MTPAHPDVGRLLMRALTVQQAYPGLQPLAQLPPETLPAWPAPMPRLSAEAVYLLECGDHGPDAFAAVLQGASHHASANVLVAGRGRVLIDTDNVWREFPGVALHDRYYWRDQYVRRTRRVKGVVFAFRSQANNYYHTLVDNLPRLFWLHQPALRGIPVKVLLPDNYVLPWEEHYLPRMLPDTASVLRVDARALWAGDETVFGSYLSRSMSGFLPRRYLDFFLPRVLPQRPRRRCHRLYITRRNAPGGRRVLNEPDVMALLARYDFTPVALETLDLPAQVELFYDAEAVVAPHGAGLTNMLFAESIDLVELHPRRAIMPHYFYMARAMGHRYRYLCADEPARNSAFGVDLVALATLLDEIVAGRRLPDHPLPT